MTAPACLAASKAVRFEKSNGFSTSTGPAAISDSGKLGRNVRDGRVCLIER